MAPTGLICVLHRIFVMENGPNVLQCKNVKKLRYDILAYYSKLEMVTYDRLYRKISYQLNALKIGAFRSH